MKNIVIFLASGITFSSLIAAPTHAEGGNKRSTGDWGINRRVLTPTSYAEVGGNFSVSLAIPLGDPGSPDDWNTNQDSPTFYLGSHGDYKTNGQAEVDAGLQYDAQVDTGKKRGMWCFIRNSSPDTLNFIDQYCSLKYYDDVLHTSVTWFSGIDTFGGANAKSFQDLSYLASLDYQIDERSGIASMGYNHLGRTQATSTRDTDIQIGSGRIYWAAPGSTSAIYSTLQIDAKQGDSKIIVASNDSFLDLSIGTSISIGNAPAPTFESKVITSIDKTTHTLTLDSPLAFDHGKGTAFSWQLTCGVAHNSVNRAPWAGSPIFNTNATGTWRVKRVVGMTRRNGISSELDDSRMGCTFYDGNVRRVGEAAPHIWGVNDVDQNNHNDKDDTGYDARANPADPLDADLQRNPALIYDQRISTRAHPMPPDSGGERSPQSKTIVEFANLNVENAVARGNSLQSQQAQDAITHESRYTRETVLINLRKLPTVHAGAVAPALAH